MMRGRSEGGSIYLLCTLAPHCNLVEDLDLMN